MSTNFLQFSHPCVTRIIICTVLKDSLRFEIFFLKIYLNYSRESREFRCTKKSSSTIETVQVKFSTLKFIYVILLISRIYIFATIYEQWNPVRVESWQNCGKYSRAKYKRSSLSFSARSDLDRCSCECDLVFSRGLQSARHRC